MIKILYITDQIYLHGGGERVLTNKVNYFTEKKLAAAFIVTSEQRGNPPCYPINSKVTCIDLAINYNRKLSYFKPSNFIKILKHYFRLKKKIREIKPDLIITLSTQFDFYFLPFICRHIPKIKEFHSSGYDKIIQRKSNRSFLKKLYYKITDFVEAHYHNLVILNKDEKQYYKSNNTVVIPNALTNYPDNISPLNNKIAISAGRIAPVKQFDKLIRAWYLVASEQPDWKLEIYGDGEQDEVSKLQILIDENNLENQITLCGSTDELEKQMLNASLFILSSRTECFPMVLLEAMSCGLPIISFDCPNGPRNIVTDEIDGLLVEPNNEKKLANAILGLINNEMDCKEKGRQARENARRFHSDLIMDQWILLFNKLIKSNV